MRNTELHAEIGLSQLKKIDDYIKIRNSNYLHFLELCKRYDELILLKSKGVSSFSLPFIFKERIKKKQFQEFITKHGIESMPLISGNLLLQPFLKTYYDPRNFKNADFLHNNAFYIGNNQFVNEEKLRTLKKIMGEFFKERG